MPSLENLDPLCTEELRRLCLDRAYKEFRTGMTFDGVRQELNLEAREQYERGLYMFITRATVLGRWHQHKMEAFKSAILPILVELKRDEMIKLLRNNKKSIVSWIFEN